jgi:surfactin synthase thioesterase subunit
MSGLHPARVLLQLPGRGLQIASPHLAVMTGLQDKLARHMRCVIYEMGQGRQVFNHACHQDRED